MVDQLLDVLGPDEVFDMYVSQNELIMRAISRVLPSKEVGALLVQAYVEKVEWLHRCIHVPTFMQSCQDLWAVPTEEVVHEISMPFLALYMVVCTVSHSYLSSGLDADSSSACSSWTVQRSPNTSHRNKRRSCLIRGTSVLVRRCGLVTSSPNTPWRRCKL